MRWRYVLAGVLALSLLTAACAGGEEEPPEATGPEETGTGEPATLDFWVFEEGGIGSFLDTVVDEFEKVNPNVDIVVTAFPEGQFGVKVDTAIAAGDPPDLALVFGPQAMRTGQYLTLDDIIAEHAIDLSTFNDAIVGGPSDFGCWYDGYIYCLGSYQGAVMMFYNKDLLDAAGLPHPAPWPPMTVEQFIDYACQLRDEEAGVWGAAYGETILPWEMQVSPDARTVTGYINGPEYVQQLDLLARGIRDGCAPSSNILDPWAQGTDYFARGELAMVVTDFQSLFKIEKQGINYGVTGIPTPPGVEPFFDVWTDSVGIFSDTDHPDAAGDFIAFLATEGQRLRLEIEGDMPLDRAVAEELDWAGGIPGRGDALEVFAHSRPSIWIPNKWDAWGPFYDAFALMAGGEKSAQEALDDAAPAIQDNLDQAWEAWEAQEE